MDWLARVYVLPKTEVLDPQGAAILGSLHHLAFDAVADVRSGRLFQLHITNCNQQEEAEKVAREAARRLLANTIVETYEVTVEPWPAEREAAP